MSSTLISPRRIAQECAYLLFKQIGDARHKFMDGTSAETDDCGGFYSPDGAPGEIHSIRKVLTMPDTAVTLPLDHFASEYLAPFVAWFAESLPRGARWHYGTAAVIRRDYNAGTLYLLLELRAAEETLDTPPEKR